MHKKKRKEKWEVKRGDVFPLFDRIGENIYTINGKVVLVQVGSRKKMVLLNDLPKIEKMRKVGKYAQVKKKRKR